MQRCKERSGGKKQKNRRGVKSKVSPQAAKRRSRVQRYVKAATDGRWGRLSLPQVAHAAGKLGILPLYALLLEVYKYFTQPWSSPNIPV